MTSMQKTRMLIMQFVIWQERWARSFADICKDMENLLQETIWNLMFYDQMVQGVRQGAAREEE